MSAKGIATFIALLAVIESQGHAAAAIAESSAREDSAVARSLSASGLNCGNCRFRSEDLSESRDAGNCRDEEMSGAGLMESIDCPGRR